MIVVSHLRAIDEIADAVDVDDFVVHFAGFHQERVAEALYDGLAVDNLRCDLPV
ncbi:hypothetical protein SDC9_137325 [bioreactor metagenome]|uniref:Uncharacterized protein n=1 Tax=bioreactor metagenome TaxID=1076179 RepID=A0A645DM97_9ZZZZ